MSEAFERLPRRAQPRWTAPMLAVLTEERFSSEEWTFERKLDGERCLAFRRGADVRLLSRTQQRLNGTYPELADASVGQDCDDFVVDGEVVAFEGVQTSFARLQQRMQLRDPERALPGCVPQGLGGPDREARRLALPARALAGLAQVQVRERAGVRDRRLHRVGFRNSANPLWLGRFETRAFDSPKRIRRGPKRTGEKLTSTRSI
jgi:hypothetical protein